MTNTIQDTLINFGFTSLEADYLSLGHTLELEDEFHYTDYRVESHFGGFTLIKATLAKGTKGAIWSFTEYEY